MKKLIFIAMLMAACSTSDPVPKKTYTDITGNWKFQDGDIQAEFELVNFADKMTVSKGSIKYNGISYPVGVKKQISAQPPALMTMELVSLDGSRLTFYNLDVNSTYDTLTMFPYGWYSAYLGDVNFGIVKGKIYITR